MPAMGYRSAHLSVKYFVMIAPVRLGYRRAAPPDSYEAPPCSADLNIKAAAKTTLVLVSGAGKPNTQLCGKYTDIPALTGAGK